MFTQFIFVIFPYIAMAVFVVGCFQRYFSRSFQVSSLSSQFLEGKTLFWGSVPFHFGLLVVLLGHLMALFFPKTLLLWNQIPVRLIMLELTGFIFGISLLGGLVALLIRRFTNDRVRVVTTRMDLVIEGLLLVQVVLGCYTALIYRWGSSWGAANLTPYIRSLFLLRPDASVVTAMPLVIQLHIVGAFIILLLFPYTRLVHLLVAPFHYFSRPYQQVIWNWNRKTIRDPNTPWSEQRPKNN
ncbi:MAG: respiratory nitrate reductase subunit gamma [Candidatus Margulisiibacteriota bacterium]